MSPILSNKEWIYWGEHDPLFAVSTQPGKEHGGASPWTIADFLETGRRYFVDVAAHWNRYGVGSKHCVEIGCGAGRLTYQLAAKFAQVTALDVSSAQQERARLALGERAARVSLVRVEEPVIPIDDASCDGVFSCEVFQHFDSDAGIAAYIKEAHRVLVPGGSICIQLPVVGLQPQSILALPARNTVLRVLRRLGRRRMMIYRRFHAAELIGWLVDSGFADVELQHFHAAEQEGFHSYFLGRKPS